MLLDRNIRILVVGEALASITALLSAAMTALKVLRA